MTIDFESINQAVLRDVANGLHNGTAQLAPKSGAKDMSSPMGAEMNDASVRPEGLPEPGNAFALFVDDDELRRRSIPKWAAIVPRRGARCRTARFPQNSPVMGWPVLARGAGVARLRQWGGKN